MRIEVEVPYGDIDAMGHLNNVAYLAYLEWARQKYWLTLKESNDFRDIDFIVARAEIDYRAPVQMGERLQIEIRVSRLGRSSFDFSYRVQDLAGRPIAQAKTVQVMYDWETKRKKDLDETLRRRIEGFESRNHGAVS